MTDDSVERPPFFLQPTDNQLTAITTKVNELIERWGIKISQVSAWASHTHEDNVSFLSIDSGPPDINDYQRFEKMIKSLGIDPKDDDWKLYGTTGEIIDALNHALELSPKPRMR